MNKPKYDTKILQQERERAAFKLSFYEDLGYRSLADHAKQHLNHLDQLIKLAEQRRKGEKDESKI